MKWSIKVENLSKQYRMGSAVTPIFDNFYQVIEHKFSNIMRKVTGSDSKELIVPQYQSNNMDSQLVLTEEQREGCPKDHFWALRNVSFEINEGDRVGIVGKNGSGKSTLLKILSRITTPTHGQFRFRGRMISLLEVGTGFHPDLSGRENIMLNAQINGMSTKMLRKIYNDIVDFSELGPQINTPIKRYSSGMYMRLAFSVAAHLDSEILIVDEVLAVGDTGFQKKCMDKMLEVTGSGRTLIFVSHDMEAVRKICSHAILMEHGRLVRNSVTKESHDHLNQNQEVKQDKIIIEDTNPEETGSELRTSLDVTKEYILGGRDFCSEMIWQEEISPSFDDAVRLRRTTLLNTNNNQQTSFDVTEEIVIEVEFDVLIKKWPLYVHVYVDNLDGHRTFFSMDNLDIGDPVREPGTYVETCKIYSPLMNEGSYRLEIVICTGNASSHYLTNNKLSFEVVDKRLPNGIRGDWTREWFASAVRPRLQWTVKKQVKLR